MADNKPPLTDAEIIKALKCCIIGDCQGCVYGETDQRHCKDDLMKNALDLINRLEADKEALIAGQETLQKVLAEKNAEIEKLTGNLKFVRGTVERQKADNERLKKLLDDKCDRCIEKERAEAIKEVADNLYRVFAGHSDYHGDTILTKIICLKEGKPIQTAEPIDTSKNKSAAIKEFAERLRRKFPIEPMGYSGIGSMYSADGIRSKIDNLVKEMVGDAE